MFKVARLHSEQPFETVSTQCMCGEMCIYIVRNKVSASVCVVNRFWRGDEAHMYQMIL